MWSIKQCIESLDRSIAHDQLISISGSSGHELRAAVRQQGWRAEMTAEGAKGELQSSTKASGTPTRASSAAACRSR